MQKQLVKILLLSCLCLSAASASPDPQQHSLAKGDSLYQKKMYTQALEAYRAIYQKGHYTPAMLLKMAHIQEGLGHLGESLFYLNLYFLATDDSHALKKMEEVAEKNNLKGYESNENTRFFAWLQEHYTQISLFMAATALLLLSIVFYESVRKKSRPVASGAMLMLVLTALFFHVNFSRKGERGIIALPQTYLMSGPSSAASVIAVVGEGHQLQVKGREDVWVKVMWGEQEAYVRGNRVFLE